MILEMMMNDYIHAVNIGKVRIDNNLVLAPMAGVTNKAYRKICHDMGVGLTVMEMISAKAVTFGNRKTFDMMGIEEDEHPLSLQIFGHEPDIMAEAVKMIDKPYDILDVNMGCPVPKVVNNGEGSALMKDPYLAGKIVEALVAATDKPVTVKIRLGFDDDHRNAPEMAKILEAAGASMIAVHGRTRQQMYYGKADWEGIKSVKESVKIPVFGNGDIRSGEDVKKMYDETGVDGYLIARAARGNPWIFKEILDFFSGKTPEKPSEEEIVDMILYHARRLIQEKGEGAIREMRKHVGWYTAGMRNSSYIRRNMNEVETYEELKNMLFEFLIKNDYAKL